MSCSATPPAASPVAAARATRYGPYYQWSRAVAGKTVSRRLGEREAELYRSWITNRRRLEQIVAQMEQISAAAGELLLRQSTPPEPPRSVKR